MFREAIASSLAFGGGEQTIESFQDGGREAWLPVRQDAFQVARHGGQPARSSQICQQSLPPLSGSLHGRLPRHIPFVIYAASTEFCHFSRTDPFILVESPMFNLDKLGALGHFVR
jgi:hypothetical protein